MNSTSYISDNYIRLTFLKGPPSESDFITINVNENVFMKQNNKYLPVMDKIDVPKYITDISCNDRRYNYSQIISSGDDSVSCLYLTPSGKPLIIKVTFNKHEVDILSHINKYGNMCGNQVAKLLAGIKYYQPESFNNNKYDKLYYIAMQVYDGYLSDIVDDIITLSIEKKLKMIVSIFTQIVCLFRHSICYTDMSFENILYVYDHNKNITVALSNLGTSTNCSSSQPTKIKYATKYTKSVDYIIIWSCITFLLTCMTTSSHKYDKLTTTLFITTSTNTDVQDMLNDLLSQTLNKTETDIYRSISIFITDTMHTLENSTDINFVSWYYKFLTILKKLEC
jgi:hypothetical protein